MELRFFFWACYFRDDGRLRFERCIIKDNKVLN